MEGTVGSEYGLVHPSPPPAEDIFLSPCSEKSQPDFAGFNLDAAVSTVPDPPVLPPQPTPALEVLPDITIAALASAALPPVDFEQSLRRPQLTKLPAHRIQIPTFDPLGVINPYAFPEDVGGYTDINPLASPKYAEPLLIPIAAGGAQVPSPYPSPGIIVDPDQQSAPRHFVFVATPPSDMPEERPVGESSRPADIRAALEGAHLGEEPGATMRLASPSPSVLQMPSQQNWLDELASVIISARQASLGPDSPTKLRVLSHALPSPTKGHYGMALLAKIMAAVTPAQTTWVSHWHAISGRFESDEIPTSPPSTPAAPGEGADYFTTRVFDSAVAVPDYQHQAPQATSSSSSRALGNVQHYVGARPSTMPRPAVTPGTVDISITERYIPPASVSEFNNLTDPWHGRSLISDRLVELSEKCGLMVFVYPTAEGGRTFNRHYLRLLDRHLRALMVSGCMTAEDCHRLGSMRAVDNLLAFDQLRLHMQGFCSRVTNLDTTSNLHARFPTMAGRPVRYELVHAARHEVHLPPDVWTEWWERQEKERVRLELESAMRRIAATGGADPHMPASASELFAELRRAAAADMPEEGLEVGVFVVKKEQIVVGQQQQQDGEAAAAQT